MQFPAVLIGFLGDLERFFRRMLLELVLQYSLGLQFETVTALVATILENRHDHLRVLVGIYRLSALENMGITRIARPFSLFQLFDFSVGTATQSRGSARTTTATGHLLLLSGI
jgi:hypothetical protein